MELRMVQKRFFLVCFALLSRIHNNYGYIAYMPGSLGVQDDPCGPTLDGMRAAGETGLPNSPYISPPIPGQIPASSQQNYNAGPRNVYDLTSGSHNGYPNRAGSATQPGNPNGQGRANNEPGNVYSVYGGRAQNVGGQYANAGAANPAQTGRRNSAADLPINPPSVTYRVTGEVHQKTPGITQRRVKRQMPFGQMTGGQMGGGYSAQQMAMLDLDPPEYPMFAGSMGQPFMNNYGAMGTGAVGTGTAGVGQPMMALDLPDLPLGFVGPITPQVAAMYDVDIPPGGLQNAGTGGQLYGPNPPQAGPPMGQNNIPPPGPYMQQPPPEPYMQQPPPGPYMQQPPPGPYMQQTPVDPTRGYYDVGSNQGPRSNGRVPAADPYAQRGTYVQGGARQGRIPPERIVIDPQPNIRSRGGSIASRGHQQYPADPAGGYYNPGSNQYPGASGQPRAQHGDHVHGGSRQPDIRSRGRPLAPVDQPIDPNVFANKQGFKVQPNPALPTYDVGPVTSSNNGRTRSRSQAAVHRQQQSGSGSVARETQRKSNPNLQAAATIQSSQRVASRNIVRRPSFSYDPSRVGANETVNNTNTRVQLPPSRANNSQSSVVEGSVRAPARGAGPSTPGYASLPVSSNRTITNTSRIALNDTSNYPSRIAFNATSNYPILDSGPLSASRNVNASGRGPIRGAPNPGAIDIKAIPANNRHDSANGKYPKVSSIQGTNSNLGGAVGSGAARSSGTAKIVGAALGSGTARSAEARGSGPVPVPEDQVARANLGLANSRSSANYGTKTGPGVAAVPVASTGSETVSVSGGVPGPVAQDLVPASQGPVDQYDPYAQNYYDPYDYTNQWNNDPYYQDPYQDPYQEPYQDPYQSSWNPMYYNFWDQWFGFPLFGWGGYNSQPSIPNSQSAYDANYWSDSQTGTPSSNPNAALPQSGTIAPNAASSQKQASVHVQAQANVNPSNNPVQPQSLTLPSNVPNNVPNSQAVSPTPDAVPSPSIFFSPKDPYSQGGAVSSSSVYNAAPVDAYAPQNSYPSYQQDPYAAYPQNSAYAQDPNYAQNSAGAQPSAADPYANVDIYAVPQEPRHCYCELASECTRDSTSAGAHYNGQCDGIGNFVCCCRR